MNIRHPSRKEVCTYAMRKEHERERRMKGQVREESARDCQRCQEEVQKRETEEWRE
jgi:hypothetical protein